MSEVLNTVLLLALPASGKSEVRRYLAHLPPDRAKDDFHMGPTVQLDDFPYVHLMRRIDEELVKRGGSALYFEAPDRSFADPRDWGVLIELLNQDYDDLVARRPIDVKAAAAYQLDRLERASKVIGIGSRLGELSGPLAAQVQEALEEECRAMVTEKMANYPDSLDGKTLVVEFARGGKQRSSMPLEPPYGYRYSVSKLSPALLSKARILYIWVTPEESRRKNEARTDPNDPGSILHHGVPIHVMLNEYGCDDMDWLEGNAPVKGTIRIDRDGRSYDLPIARFDNRVDRTSFIREEPSAWNAGDVKSLHDGLRAALEKLAGA